MNKSYFIISAFLIIVLGVASKIYFDIWKRQTDVDKFLEEELREEKIKKKINDYENENSTLEVGSIKIIKPDISEKKESIEYLKPQRTIDLKSTVLSKPFAIITHVNKNLHLLCQDKNFNVHLLDTKGKTIWKKPFNEKILTEIFQIDFYNNKKIQYLFATERYIYVIDYKGMRVNKYPVGLDSLQKPVFLNIFDYSKNNNFRIILANESGEIYLFNKFKNILPGWNPKVQNAPLLSKPIHLREKNKDYITCIKKNGDICVYKRNGNFYKNFPLKLNKSLKDFCYYRHKSEFVIVTLSENSKIYEINLNGKIRMEVDLNSMKNAEYYILPDTNIHKDYLVVKQTDECIEIFNRKNILKKKIVKTDKANFFNMKYYHTKNFTLFSMQKNNELYFYKNYSLVHKKPIFNSLDNDYTFSFYGNSNILNIITSQDSKVNLYTFNF